MNLFPASKRFVVVVDLLFGQPLNVLVDSVVSEGVWKPFSVVRPPKRPRSPPPRLPRSL